MRKDLQSLRLAPKEVSRPVAGDSAIILLAGFFRLVFCVILQTCQRRALAFCFGHSYDINKARIGQRKDAKSLGIPR